MATKIEGKDDGEDDITTYNYGNSMAMRSYRQKQIWKLHEEGHIEQWMTDPTFFINFLFV